MPGVFAAFFFAIDTGSPANAGQPVDVVGVIRYLDNERVAKGHHRNDTPGTRRERRIALEKGLQAMG